MTIEKQIQTIRQKYSDNLMARFFDPDWYSGLDEASRNDLYEIIRTGIENPDSAMGAYAQHPDDYHRFAPMLEPMIREFHGIAAPAKIAQPHDWDSSARECDLGAIDQRLKDVSMRVRMARNVASFALPGAMTKEQRIGFENTAIAAFTELMNVEEFGGQYLSITPGSPHKINAEEYQRRVDAHQMFKDMSGDKYLKSAGISNDWPHGRGMYVSSQEDFLVWVGEEDHLRIMAMMTGGNLNALFDRLRSGLEMLSRHLPDFATSPVYGNITSCPTNLGAGMRASLHMKLPRATGNGSDLTALETKAATLGLAVRGAGGEHSGAGKDGLVDISPRARLGVSEMQIMQRLYDGAAALWEMEQKL